MLFKKCDCAYWLFWQTSEKVRFLLFILNAHTQFTNSYSYSLSRHIQVNKALSAVLVRVIGFELPVGCLGFQHEAADALAAVGKQIAQHLLVAFVYFVPLTMGTCVVDHLHGSRLECSLLTIHE